MLNTLINVRENNHILTSADYEYNQHGVLYLTGEITNERCCEIINAIHTQIRKGKDAISLYINSPGGDVSPGFALIDTILLAERQGLEISTCVLSQAYSMAALISSAGTKGKRYILPHSQMMVHGAIASEVRCGKADEIGKVLKKLDMRNKEIVSFLSVQTGQSTQKIADAIAVDCWLDANEAIRFGLADKIGDPCFENCGGGCL